MPVNDVPEWGIVGSLTIALLAVGRTLWRWEQTFSDAARDEIGVLRAELAELRGHVARCEIETAELRNQNAALRYEIDALKRHR